MSADIFCLDTTCGVTWRHLARECRCLHVDTERIRKYDGGNRPLLCGLCRTILGWWEPTPAKSLYIFHEYSTTADNGVHTYSHLGA